MQEILNEREALDGIDVKRVVFHEVTKNAVIEALANPRELNQELIDAYLARRALDYLVGFSLSPVLAQAAGFPLRRARAVGRAAADLRARSRDRSLQTSGILDHRRRIHDHRRRGAASRT